MGDNKVNFRRERKRRRLENPPESENDSDYSDEDAGSSDDAYDELYDTDDDEDNNNGDVMEPLEEEELKSLSRKRKMEEVYGAERNEAKGKKSKDRLKVPTSAEEVKRLRETEKLFHSNLYRLQIEEMLKEVKVKKKYVQKLDEWFPSLQSSLLAMEDQEEQDLSDLEWLQKLGIALPLHQNHEFKGRFIFKAPASVTLIGSYADGCSVGPKLNVDIAVDMPEGYSGFGSHLLTMLVVYLARKRRLAPQMSSYQIVRIVWNFLSETDWTTSDGAPTLGDGEPSEFLQKYQVVFLDVTGVYNFAYSLTAYTYTRVRSESRSALQFLDNPILDSFPALFITPMPFSSQFDHVIRFTNTTCLENMVDEKATTAQKLDGIVNKERLAVSLILEVLQRGLSSRVKEWGVQSSPTRSWPISQSPPKSISSAFQIGLNLDPQHAFSILNKGPEANEPEAADFREFWGEKCELRRFQDGSICEAVVWLDGKASLAERRVVCKVIAKYLLQHRLGLDSVNVIYLADQIEETLHLKSIRPRDVNYGTGEEATLVVLSAFGQLSKKIRELTDLPLEITEIQGVSPTFRYAEVFPPLSARIRNRKNVFENENCAGFPVKSNEQRLIIPHFTPAMEVVVSLGLSGKWPSKAEAVRRIRAAFNIKIAKGLQDSFDLTSQAHPEYVDVVHEGFVFRLRVAYLNEIKILKEVRLADGSLKLQETPEALALECRIVHLPSITGYLHGLHQQCPAFGPTACLAKRWIASQMTLGDHIPEIAVELLVAYTFLRPEPFSTPTQPQTAFLRLLHFIGKTNWDTQPIILNFKGDITQEEITEIEKRFIGVRKSLPPLFIVTPTDHKKSVWTLTSPSLTILIRLAQLAQAALTVLEKPYTAEKPDLEAWKQIFIPDLSVYDVLIHLERSVLPRKRHTLNLISEKDVEVTVPRPYKRDKAELIPVVGFDPLDFYLRDLKASFGDFALFFYDTYGGGVIGVVWKPAALEPKNFSVNQINGRYLVDGRLELNQEAIIEDFHIMGKGIICHVDTPASTGCLVPEEEE